MIAKELGICPAIRLHAQELPDPFKDGRWLTLAHGGGESLVLASSTEEFLSLLAIGYRDLGYDFRSEPPPPDKHVRYLRNWLADKFRLTPAGTALSVVERANAQQPGFHHWLREWSEKQARQAEPGATRECGG